MTVRVYTAHLKILFSINNQLLILMTCNISMNGTMDVACQGVAFLKDLSFHSGVDEPSCLVGYYAVFTSK